MVEEASGVPDDRGFYDVPEDLDERGAQLWRDLNASWEQDAGARLMMHEACRLADRMEKLDRILRGDVDTWVTIELPRGDSDEPLRVKVDGALAEARLHVTTLRQVLAQLRRVRPTGRLLPGTPQEPTPPPERNPVDEFTAARHARRSGAANP
jgi:hypothetical protein